MSADKRKGIGCAAVGILALVVGALLSYWLLHARGVTLELTNLGPVELRSTEAVVTGATYELGTLAVGESTSLQLWPVGDSSLTLRFLGRAGLARECAVDCYIAPGSTGRLWVVLEDGALKELRDETRLAP